MWMDAPSMIRKIRLRSAVTLLAKSIFYFVVLLALIYLYHYNRVGGAAFIYNEF
jgi:hypothetical protein